MITDDADDKTDASLTAHSLSLRKAIQYADSLVRHDNEESDVHHLSFCSKLHDNERNRRRMDAYFSFWNKSDPQVDVLLTDNLVASEFHRDYMERALPCLIRGLDAGFSGAIAAWTNENEHGDREINARWFVEALGIAAKVPVKVAASDEHGASILAADDVGRGVEWQSQPMSVQEWCQYLQQQRDQSKQSGSLLYLKDWHLQLFLDSIVGLCSSHFYDVPTLFPHDLLNAHLQRFTNGDYRFVYWGPANSHTPRHADVLNSWSWSYNVAGTKRWTFYRSGRYASDSGPADCCCVRMQHAGELMLVPPTWQHDVVNVVETLSINHNWVPACSIDLTLQCLEQERALVERELQAWSIVDLEAHESMLRGCVGLDASMFFMMLTCRLAELLSAATHPPRQGDDHVALADALQQLILDDKWQIQERLNATLASSTLAKRSLQRAMALLACANEIPTDP